MAINAIPVPYRVVVKIVMSNGKVHYSHLPAKSIEDAERVIAEDVRFAKGDRSYGGLIDPDEPGARSYEVFRAEWENVSDQIGK